MKGKLGLLVQTKEALTLAAVSKIRQNKLTSRLTGGIGGGNNSPAGAVCLPLLQAEGKVDLRLNYIRLATRSAKINKHYNITYIELGGLISPFNSSTSPSDSLSPLVPLTLAEKVK